MYGPSRLFHVSYADLQVCWLAGGKRNILRARKRSSERIAMALIRRMTTALISNSALIQGDSTNHRRVSPQRRTWWRGGLQVGVRLLEG